MPTFALEKQVRLEWKQMRFILTLPVAGAVCTIRHYASAIMTHTHDRHALSFGIIK